MERTGRVKMFPAQATAGVNAAVNAVTQVATGAVNAVTTAASGAANAVGDVFNSVNNATNNAAKNISKNGGLFNSLIPLNNAAKNANAPKNAAANNGIMGMFGNAPANNAPKNAATNNAPKNAAANNAPKNAGSNMWPANNAGANNAGANNAGANSGSSWFSFVTPLSVFAFLILVFLAVFTMYTAQIKQGYEYTVSQIRGWMNLPTMPNVAAPVAPTLPPPAEVTVAPVAPQTLTPAQQEVPQSHTKSLVEKILPSSGGEVFNVAQNKFTYYDAEPLCKAMGAELATYEQVKDAWGNGADWCNYGWVKGQMAVYPTQKETFDKLQMGPVDERNACGTVGINGGFFDNPEFRYGVNCYGKKPEQSAHDQEELMSEGKVPKSTETLKIDKMVAEFKGEADSLFVKPFNDQKWASS